MKKQKVILLIIILLLCIILVSIISNQNKNIKNKQITIKEMSESTQVADLQTQINELNASHTEYANYVKSCKQAIATALTNEGITTSANDTLETMAANIENIFSERTKLDESVAATADNISVGKQAYVNGELITGNKVDNTSSYEILHLSWTGNGSISSSIDVSSKLTDYKSVKDVYFNNIMEGICASVVNGNGVPSKIATYDSTTGILTIYASEYAPSTGYLYWYRNQTYYGTFVFLY